MKYCFHDINNYKPGDSETLGVEFKVCRIYANVRYLLSRSRRRISNDSNA
jgi:hypothetical protein